MRSRGYAVFGVILSALLGIRASSAGAEAFAPLEHPAFPLFTICSTKIDWTPQDAQRLAQNFELLHGRLSPAQFDELHKLNPRFKCLVYVNSTYTRGVADVATVESKYRRSLCMHFACRIASAMTPSDTTFPVAPPETPSKHGPAGQDIAIRASTVDGDFSSTAAGRPSTKYYVFWIRIGEELMRVDAFDPKTGMVAVTRGFAGTTATRHESGARVFSPVYLGFRRTEKEKYPGLHPGGPGTRLRYVFDPQQPDGYPFLAQLVVQAMQNHHADGVWLDTLNTGDFNLSDCLGRAVRPWNFRKDEVYRPDDFRLGQERKIASVQQVVHDCLGKYPVLVANNLKPTTYYPGRGGMKRLLMSTADKPRPLDGFCMEGGLGWHKEHSEEEMLSWRARIEMLMDAAQNGLAAMPILAGAGAKSRESESDTHERDRAERFGYASYLLAVEKEGRTLMGTYAFYAAGGKRSVRLHPIYTYPIGDPAETVAPGEIDKYLVPGTPVYRRKFTGGMVLVNPSEKEGRVRLEPAFLDPDSAALVTDILLAPGTAKILLNPARRQAATAPKR